MMRLALPMLAACLLSFTVSAAVTVSSLATADPRNIRNGLKIPAKQYCDQPYVVAAANGEWVVVLTTGVGHEGSTGQHVASAYSSDRGQTWSPLVDIEPPDGPESSWATPLITPYGRIYVFYTYNGDNITTLPGSTSIIRSDTHGWYCFKYSDDNGRTWSAQRYRIPVRITACDLANPWNGELMLFWGIDKPKVWNGKVRFAFTKLGRYFLENGEGWLLESDNLLTERDPDKLRFVTLPEGEHGIRNNAYGSVQEEHNLVPLAGDDMFCVYRLNEQTPMQSFSRDGGRSWTLPERMTYGPSQRTVKQPRACPKLFKTACGRYLLWYHNHSGKSFENRNPVFLTGGILHADGMIRWSEPEIVLFDPTASIRMSYPDLIEQDGRYWFTETQKTIARAHEIAPALLHGLWAQATNRTVCAAGLLDETSVHTFGQLDGRGLSLELLFSLDSEAPGQTLFSKTDASGKGVTVRTSIAADGTPAITLTLSDGERSVSWDTDPGRIRKGWTHHAVFLCDFSACIIGVLLDGRYADGALRRQYGWGRIRSDLEAVTVSEAPVTDKAVLTCRLYSRALTTSEAVGNYRSLSLPVPPEDESAPRTVACWPLDAQKDAPTLTSVVNAAYTFKALRHTPGATNAQAVMHVPNPDNTPGFARSPSANAGAVFFDNRHAGYLCASNVGARVEHTAPFTVEGWLCRTDDPGADLWYVCGARDIGAGWMLTLRRDGGRVGYHLYMHNNNVAGFFPGGWVTENPGWQHLALVYDPARNLLGAWELFLNGVTAGVLANTQAPNSHSVANFYLGGRPFSAANTFRGIFDYWRVSSGARAPKDFLRAQPDPGTAASPNPVPDARHLSNGWTIPSNHYADQPYIVKTDDGAWLCVITTGSGKEGAPGQHIVSMRSTDRGRTWEKAVDVEPADGPESSYAVLLKTPHGRVYCFYNHNTDRVKEVKREDKGVYARVDSLGHYVFKYTDDHGRTWSAQRYDIPMRAFDCDLQNTYKGELKFFWNVGKPLIHGTDAILVMHKVGAMGAGFFAQSEGAFLKSPNMLTERDPSKITFATLPEGTVGLRTPPGGGRVAEEQSIVSLSDGSMYCVYRTIDGWPACAYSRDGARTWTAPAYKTYTPGGRRVKHPRAANFVWKYSNGKFLYWFHNHGGRFVGALGANGKDGRSPYDDRNPAWLMAGREVDTPEGKRLEWSQPEILLYDDDPYIRMSYPDLVEDGGELYITETQKTIGRTHLISPVLIDGLFAQWEAREVATNGRVLNLTGRLPAQVAMPKLPALNRRDAKSEDQRGIDLRAGFSLDVWFTLPATGGADGPSAISHPLLDSRASDGSGILLAAEVNGALRVTLNDGRTECAWASDQKLLTAGKAHHAVITVDGGPKIITFVVDGMLCDGGDQRQFGWGRFSPNLRTPNGSATLTIAPAVKTLRLYNRALRTSEAVGNFQAELWAGARTRNRISASKTLMPLD